VSPVPTWTCDTYQYAPAGLERGSTVDVKVSFIATLDLDEVTVHTWVTGYDEDIEAESPQFDVFDGNMYTRTMELELPEDLDAKEDYTLYVQVENKKDLSGVDRATVDTEIQRIANMLEILSIELYDSDYGYTHTFDAGDTIYADVVVKNRGNYPADDVYVQLAIKELGISRTVYLGDLEGYDNHDSNDNEDSEEVTVALQLPQSMKAGTYVLEVSAFNDEVSDEAVGNILVSGYQSTPEEQQPGKVEVSAQVSSNEVEQGKGAVYAVLVANFGSTSQNFIVETVGTEGWATTTITPQTFTLAPGQSKLVNIYLAAGEEAVVGEHIFSAKVRYGSESKQYSLTANVTKGAGEINWKLILMIIGIVLAVAIIVLLIVLLTTKKKPATETTESYY
jgi:uncharacterized membrane protein